MTYVKLIDQVAHTTHLTKAEVRKVFGAFFQAVRDVVDTGDPLVIPGFGKFFLRIYAPRSGRNPRTGERVPIPGGPRLRFHPSQGMDAPDGSAISTGWTRRGAPGKRHAAEAAAAAALASGS